MAQALVPTFDGCWVMQSGAVAHVPSHGVIDGRLRPEAEAALAAQGFCAPDKHPYAVTVLTATSCNLGCGYCFQNTGANPATPFAPRRIEKSLLDGPTVAEIQRFVEDQMSSGGYDELSVLLFGGEPLLNPTGTLDLLAALHPLGLVDADMVTNAVLLTPTLAGRLREAGLCRAQVTFDGHRDDHNATRRDHAGRGSYDTILTNLRSVSRAVPELGWTFRVNVTASNLGGIRRLIDDIADLGVADAETYLALVDDVGAGFTDVLTYSEDLSIRFEGLVDHALAQGVSIQPFFNSVDDCRYCGTIGGETGAVVNADGTLYSCWENAGRPEWAVGHVRRGYLPRAALESRWVACDYDVKSHGTPAQTRAFYDRVNAHILERTYRPGDPITT